VDEVRRGRGEGDVGERAACGSMGKKPVYGGKGGGRKAIPGETRRRGYESTVAWVETNRWFGKRDLRFGKPGN